MSALLDLVLSSLKGGGLQNIAQQSGLSKDQGKSALNTAMPMLLEMFMKQSSGAQGSQLAQAVSAFGGGSQQSTTNLLEQLLGGQAKNLTASLQQTAGLQPQQASSFLNNLLPVVLGSLNKAGAQNATNTASLLGGALSKLNAGGGSNNFLAGMLDQDGDGDVDMQDMLKVGAKMVGNFFKK